MLWDWQGETNSDVPLILDHATRRGLNVVLVARDQVALEQLAEEVRGEGVQAKVVVEDFAKEGAVSRVVEKVTNIISSFAPTQKLLHLIPGCKSGAWGSREQRWCDGRPLHALPGYGAGDPVRVDRNSPGYAGGGGEDDQGQHHHSCPGVLKIVNLIWHVLKQDTSGNVSTANS